METKEELKEEIEDSKQEKYRKKHLAFHHSPNRFCLNCIEIGRQEAIKLLKSFMDYANKENKDNHLWYKMQLENLLEKLKEKK